MHPGQILKEVSRLGWRTSLGIVIANVRQYGWAATIMRVVKRESGSSNLHRGHQRRLARLKSDEVDSSRDIFGKPCILIVGALDLPQCKKYRVLQKVEFFNSIGWGCHYAHYMDDSRVISYLQISTAIIFYRVPVTTQMDTYLAEAYRLGIKTFYDIDDPVFSSEIYGENSNLKHLDANERTHLLKGAVDYRDAMHKVDNLILSTSYLQKVAASEIGKPAYLWRNFADAATLSMVESLPERSKDSPSGAVVIGYASGSRAHDEDFRVVCEALVQMLRKYENVSLQVIGYLVIPLELQVFEDRVNLQSFASYMQYLESLSQTDISIVPLTIDRFNECKSAIRYIEAAVCGVPTVASAVGQFSEIIVSGSDGFLADCHQAWVSSLEQLIEDRTLRLSMGMEARKKVMEYHTVSAKGAIEPEVIQQFLLSHE